MQKPHAAPEKSLALFNQILSCRSYADLNTRLLDPIAKHIGASSGVFLQILHLATPETRVARHNYIGPSPATVETYIDESLFVRDPCVKPLLSCASNSPEGSASKVILLSRLPGWRQSAYEAEFLMPFDVGDVMALAVPVRSAFETTVMCLGFHRVHEERRFERHEEQALRQLAPALESVLVNLAYAESLSLSGTMLGAMATLGEAAGVVVLDDDLTIRHANRTGLSHLGLLASDAQDAMIVRSDVFGTLRERLINVSRRGERLLSMTLSADGRDAEVREFVGPSNAPYYLIVTHGEGKRAQMESACLQHDLSYREIEVAQLICAGQSNATIASQLGIALRTVENHLRSVYAKTSVNSRTQLISRLIAIT